MHNLTELGFRAVQWTNLTWNTEYFKSMSALGVYIFKISTRHIGMSLTRTAWVKLNCLRTGIGGFGSSIHQRGLASKGKCECGPSSQTAYYIILACPIHRAPRGRMGVTVWMTKQGAGSAPLLPASDLDNAAGWGDEGVCPRSPFFCCV